MEAKHLEKRSAQKLYWDQSQFAWLVGTNPFANSELKCKNTAIEKFARRLFRIGGNQVCVAFDDCTEVIETIAKFGRPFQGAKIKLRVGEPNDCHRNSLRLWKSNKKKYTVLTGYGLSDDQMWRRHWWLMDVDGNIVETTVLREIYFGATYAPQGAELLCKAFGV